MSDAMDLSIDREDRESHGRYVIRLSGGAEAELTYRRSEGNVLIADHTYVPNAFRGQGLAEKLVQRAIDDAHREGSRIVPLCSYVDAQFRRHPEWAPLLA